MQEAAEVDLERHTKLAELGEDAAYSPFERQLAQLEALSQLPPLCISHYAKLYRYAPTLSMCRILHCNKLRRYAGTLHALRALMQVGICLNWDAWTRCINMP